MASSIAHHTWAILLFQNNNAQVFAAAAYRRCLESFSPKTVIRAGFGMYNDLQDALGYRADQNFPFKSHLQPRHNGLEAAHLIRHLQ